jgi:hypothetical protein
MGNDYFGQDKAIEELRGLSQEAKEYLGHHIRNGLFCIAGNIEIGKLQEAKDAVYHMEKDLARIGC